MESDLDIRRPELSGVRREGTVGWYRDGKDYGRIAADDGEVLFVHFSTSKATATEAWRLVSA